MKKWRGQNTACSPELKKWWERVPPSHAKLHPYLKESVSIVPLPLHGIDIIFQWAFTVWHIVTVWNFVLFFSYCHLIFKESSESISPAVVESFLTVPTVKRLIKKSATRDAKIVTRRLAKYGNELSKPFWNIQRNVQSRHEKKQYITDKYQNETKWDITSYSAQEVPQFQE